MKKYLITLTAIVASLLLVSTVYAQAAGPDFSKATEKLGVTAAELGAAIGSPPNFKSAAEKFGVSVEELIAVLPAPPASEIPEGYTAEDFMK
jgi:hypothetical protein